MRSDHGEHARWVRARSQEIRQMSWKRWPTLLELLRWRVRGDSVATLEGGAGQMAVFRGVEGFWHKLAYAGNIDLASDGRIA